MSPASRKATRLIYSYFFISGIAANIIFATVVIFKPELTKQLQSTLIKKIAVASPTLGEFISPPPPQFSLDEEIATNHKPWRPRLATAPSSRSVVHTSDFPTLQDASDALNDGEVLVIAAGVYQEPFTVRNSDVIVIGEGHVIIEKTAAKGKAAILNRGDNNEINNIECRYIEVNDKNGACIRHEGTNLILDHVYFHDSEQGILSAGNPGLVQIINSRFEKLGKRGRSHAIYINGGELYISGSEIIAAKGQGHEVKSRAKRTSIYNSVIASYSSQDSRLIDIPNGGELIITDSVLLKGPLSSNQDLIGFGLEGIKHTNNQISLTNNVIFLERLRVNKLIHASDPNLTSTIVNNVIIGKESDGYDQENLTFESRTAANITPYPAIPKR